MNAAAKILHRPIALRSSASAMLLSLAARCTLALLSAGLLICSLPSPDIGWLAWIALVPLLIACNGVGPWRASAIGFVNGFVASFGIYNWLFQLPAFGWRHAFVLATYVALYPTLFSFALAISNRWRVPLILSTPALWTLVEYLRANAGFLALPWGTLAHAQHQNLAILQFASVAGEHGVTFLVALGNSVIAQLVLNWMAKSLSYSSLWKTEAREDFPNRTTAAKSPSIPLFHRGKQTVSRDLVLAILIIAAVHAWGALVLFTAHTGPKIRVAAVQPNIQIAERESKSGKAESYQRLVELTKMAAAAKPDLIVWPESAVAGNLHNDDATVATLQSLVRTIGVPIVVGAAEVQKFSSGERETTIRSRVFNSAYLLEPANGLSEPYRKRMLLPFGEYLPYEKTIPWPQWLAPKVSEMTRGENAHLFRLPNGIKVGALICWENLFAPLARDSVASGAQILVQLTNDVWFGRTAAPLQHNLASVLRAVENRVPVVIASNSGPSQVIDTHGRVVASVARLFSAEIVTAEVAAEPAAPVYTYLGDFFALLMINMLIILCFWRISVNRPDPDSKVFPDDINGGAR